MQQVKSFSIMPHCTPLQDDVAVQAHLQPLAKLDALVALKRALDLLQPYERFFFCRFSTDLHVVEGSYPRNSRSI